MITCRTGSLEILNPSTGFNVLYYLPHRQLRKLITKPIGTTSDYLPHRQLRKLRWVRVGLPSHYLPHRQLRKFAILAVSIGSDYLPHRQLRNVHGGVAAGIRTLPAAQAA